MKNRSVIRAIDILDLISRSRNGMSLNEVVKATGIPKTTAYEIILMLLEKSMLQVQDGKVKQYQLGVQSFIIGNRFLQNMDMVSQARPVVDECSEKLNMTVFLAMLDGTQIIYLYKKEPREVPIHTESISNRGDVYCTSLGKAILSQLPDKDLYPIVDSLEYRRRTVHTIMNKDDLLSDLARTRKRGYALDDREVFDFVMCVGAPVFDHKGNAVAGISAAGMYSEERDTEQEGKLLQEAGLKLSRLLGFDDRNSQ